MRHIVRAHQRFLTDIQDITMILYMMSKDLPLDGLLEDIDLLDKVVEFKKKFYPRGWARYDLAKKGTLKLVPDQYRIEELEKRLQIDARYVVWGQTII